ncbi:MAG: polyprenyl synthetase family protein [Spirochaetaceae bacterium]|jgi:octaprenyl-diphosphate synthase|nr:polyprenyl synthetase family protein [Spirochaetaceae bacterium]
MNNLIALRLKKIETALAEVLPAKVDGCWAKRAFSLPYDLTVPYGLAGPCIDLVGYGGKRWRPLLAHLICESLGGGEAALPLLPLLELSHTASLIHDDIEDNSALRRGKPAAHILYGTDTAINSGAFLYFFSASVIDTWDAPPDAKAKLYAAWLVTMRRLHLGQAMDISWHNSRHYPRLSEYVTMCRLKTGVLSRFAVELGICAAENALRKQNNVQFMPDFETKKRALEGAAEKLGLGFQIVDDAKNLTQGVPGKKRGDDIVEGKKSLPILFFVHGVEASAQFCREAARSQEALPENDTSTGINAESPNDLNKSALSPAERAGFVQWCIEKTKEGGLDSPELFILLSVLEKAGAALEAEKIGKAFLAESSNTINSISTAGLFSGVSAAETEEARSLLQNFADSLFNG